MGISVSTNLVTISKSFNQTENEDFVYHFHNDEGYFHWVVCDGAGGSGVFCKEWARFIAENVPVNPGEFQNDQINWLAEISEQFYKNVISKKDLSDLILNKKVYRDGSNSTMSALWLNQKANEIYFSNIGDSCIFYFAKKKDTLILKYISPYNTFTDIEPPNPILLNWNAPIAMNQDLNILDIEDDFVIVMASDSMARWIIQTLSIIDLDAISTIFNSDFVESMNKEKYEDRKVVIRLNNSLTSITEFINYLKQLSETQESFENNMRQIIETEQIDLDDYSLIFIQGNVSK